MSKPDSPSTRRAFSVPRPNIGSALLAAFCLTLLQAPLCASATLAVADEPPPPPSLERSAPAKEADTKTVARGWRLRCWQHGRLLFEEDDITLPPDGSRYTLKLEGRDRDGRPLYVAETLNATCLVRHAPAAHVNPALPR